MKTIFVSSTFKDMHFERDVLQEVVLPRVNAVAQEYIDHISFCDLRWGINTSEIDSEAGSRKVLEVCLDEIERCSPYMIVILGERYGWIPSEQLIANISELKKMQLEDLRKSVTALEIEYGALNSPKTQKTLFYFREILNEVPEEYRAEDEEHERLLNELKERIRKLADGRVKTYQVKWNGEKLVGLDTLAEMLIEDVIALLKPEWEQNMLMSAYEKERHIHLSFIEEKEKAFRARKKFADKYIQMVECGEQLTLFKAEPGSGKSTLLSYMALQLKNKGYDILPIVCGLTPHTNTALGVLEQIVHYMEEQLKLSHLVDREEHADVEKWCQRLEDLAIEYKARKQKIIVLIDALDQLSNDEWRENLIFMPQMLSEYVQYVMTCLTDFHTFDKPEIFLPKMSEDDKKEVISGTLTANGRELSRKVTTRMVRFPAADTPLYLSLMIQRLLMLNKDDFTQINMMGGSMEAIEDYQLQVIESCPQTLQAMSAEVMRIAGERVNAVLASRALKYIAVSRYGLRADDLAGLLKENYNPLDFAHLIAYMSDSFLVREDGRYDFSHKSIRQGILEQCDNQISLHREVFEYLHSLDERDEIRIKEIVFHGIRANQKQFLIDYVDAYEKDNYICAVAEKDLYDYTVKEDCDWLCVLLEDATLEMKDSFLDTVRKIFIQYWNGNVLDREKVYRIRENLLKCARRYEECTHTRDAKGVLASCLALFGETLCKLSKAEEGMILYQEGFAIQEGLLLEKDTIFRRRKIKDLLIKIAENYRLMEKRVEAHNTLQRALEIAQQIAQEETSDQNLLDVADIYDEIGRNYTSFIRIISTMEKASLMYEKGLELRKQVMESDNNPEGKHTLIYSYLNLAEITDHLGMKRDDKKRVEYVTRALELSREVLEERQTVYYYNLVADCYLELVKVNLAIHTEESLEQAYVNGQKAEQLYSLVLKEVPSDYYYLQLIDSYLYTAVALYEKKQLQEALEYGEKGLGLEKVYSDLSGEKILKAEIYNLMGDIYKELGETQKAEQYYQLFQQETCVDETRQNIYAELLAIFEYMDEEIMSVLPFELCNTIKWNASRFYQSPINPKLSLDEQSLLEGTENYLTLLYANYMATEEEQEELVHAMEEAGNSGEDLEALIWS